MFEDTQQQHTTERINFCACACNPEGDTVCRCTKCSAYYDHVARAQYHEDSNQGTHHVVLSRFACCCTGRCDYCSCAGINCVCTAAWREHKCKQRFSHVITGQ
eukprot:6044-Heterococcus_DN1.PRE.3